jgi:hypothetical protein
VVVTRNVEAESPLLSIQNMKVGETAAKNNKRGGLATRLPVLYNRGADRKIAREKRVGGARFAFPPQSNSIRDVSFRDGGIAFREGRPKILRSFTVELPLVQDRIWWGRWRRRIEAFGKCSEGKWWNVPSLASGKQAVDRDQQTKVITRVKTESLDSNIANRVARAQWSLPKDNVNAGAFPRGGVVVGVKVEAAFINRVQNFESSIKKLLERVPAKRSVWKTAKIDIKVPNNQDGGTRLRGKQVNMWDEREVVVAIGASHLSVHIREIDVDDVKVSSNANTIKFNRAAKRSYISGEVAKIAGNKGAPKDMGSLIRANACE